MGKTEKGCQRIISNKSSKPKSFYEQVLIFFQKNNLLLCKLENDDSLFYDSTYPSRTQAWYFWKWKI